ncbi:DUF4199 domain-containing protein [Flavobacteriaceae bacterium F89]|uniref:DUF4199 domain-containing protein n=1 Tax=Cerina litoralis TaxID=2874477 RepID=A0AAE3ERM5_9FLAO|nr:DUF4199 domain-containing protein [Cerina litoralis]MCG2459957.1 DUF4199 domain-containing protein [Cerina litoralis]
MEENQVKTGKFAWTYGAIGGGIGIVFTLMLMSMDMLYDQGWGKSVVSTLILVAVVYLAISSFKKQNQGFLTLKQSMKVGIGTALVAAIVALIFTYLLINFFVPDFMDKTAELSRITIMEKNPQLTPEQLDNAIDMQKKFFWVAYPMILIFNLFIGFIVSLITGIFLKKERKA